MDTQWSERCGVKKIGTRRASWTAKVKKRTPFPSTKYPVDTQPTPPKISPNISFANLLKNWSKTILTSINSTKQPTPNHGSPMHHHVG